MSPLSYLCRSSRSYYVDHHLSNIVIAIGEQYRRGKQDLWEIRSKKWMRTIWHSFCMSWDSIYLCRKHTRQTQERRNWIAWCPWPTLRPHLPSFSLPIKFLDARGIFDLMVPSDWTKLRTPEKCWIEDNMKSPKLLKFLVRDKYKNTVYISYYFVAIVIPSRWI